LKEETAAALREKSSSLENFSQSVSALQEKLSASQQALAQVEEERKNALSSFEVERASLTQALDNLQMELEKEKNFHVALEEMNEKLKQSLNDEMEEHKNFRAEMTLKSKEDAERFAALEARLKEEELARQNLATIESSLREAVAKFKAEEEEKQKMHDTETLKLKEEIDEVRSQLESVENNLKRRIEMCDELRQKLHDVEEEAQNSKMMYEQRETDSKVAVDRLAEQLAVEEDTRKKFEEECDSLRRKLKDMEDEMEAQRQQQISTDGQYSELQSEAERMKESYQELQEQLNQQIEFNQSLQV
jgi:chromosome segregation ATPase